MCRDADPQDWGADDRLIDAVEAGDHAAARALLDAGANPDFDSYGLRIIDVAIRRMDAAMVLLLREFGAVIDPPEEDRRRMHRAASDPWLLELLLSLGFDPDVRDKDGWTPLHFAAAYGVTASASLLLAAGADPEPRTLAGKTPADIAAANGRRWPLE